MASAHFSAKEVKRGMGHSAVASAAYNARASLDDLRTGLGHDYTRHQSRCLFEGIYAPKDAPEWAKDRAQLWNHVEAFEKHRSAILAQDIDIALPHELTLEQNRRLLQDWVRENVTRKGLIADVAIHEPDKRGDDRNIHAHVMIVTRKLDGSEFVRIKDRFETYSEKDAARKADLLAMRSSWEKLANRHLERYGHDARIDMSRKQDGEATVHMGRHATAQERRGKATELGDRNREIEAENARRQAANENSRPAAAMWDELDGSTLSNMRQREREARPSRSAEDDARRAMDDLARTDPHGTARHFGHHAGDRLKSPEDMRREQAERLRSFADEPTPEPVREPSRDSASPDPGRERTQQRSTWTGQRDGWDGLSSDQQRSARQSFEAWRDKRSPEDKRPAFSLPEYVDYVQQREARKQDARPAAEAQPVHQVDAKRDHLADRMAWAAMLRGLAEEGPQKPARGPEPVADRAAAAKAPEPTRERERERPGVSHLQAALSAARERLNSLGGRLDAAFTVIRERLRDREAMTINRPQATEPEQVRESATTHRQQTGPTAAREDTSSRRVNRDFAEDLLAEARQTLAREAATERSIARDYDQHQREKEGRELERVRELLRQERQRRAPYEPN